MTRAYVSYTERHGPMTAVPGGIDVTEPVAGFYRMKLRGNGVLAGIHIWHGPPLDPDTGEEMDRSWRWQAQANGEPVEFDDVWPVCADEPISEADYQFYAKRQRWARDKAPDTAFADPRRRHDPLTSLLPF